MDNLRSEIANHFGIGCAPDVQGLIIRDGFDELEKEGALRFFTGKTWEDVLRHLQGPKNEAVFGAAYYLEEWAVLSKGALSYYLRAYLEFLFENLTGTDPAYPNVEFIAFFVHELYQVIYIHKGSPFSTEQTHLLKKVMATIEAHAKDRNRVQDYSSGWIMDNVGQFLTELQKRKN